MTVIKQLINLWLSARTLPPFLCQCSVLRVFKAKARQIRRKSKQALESPRIEPGASNSEGRALRDRSEIIGGGGGSDICPQEKPKKFDPPLTLGKKIVTLPKTIPKKYDPPL